MVNLNKMYDGVVNSPETYLTQNLAADATIIYVADSSVFGSLPNLAVIGTDQNAETILIKSKRSDGGLEVQRALEGSAKRWEKTTAVARNFTNFDYQQIKDNIEKLNKGKQENLTAGNNIQITNGRISATDTKYDDAKIKEDISELKNSQLAKASQTEAESGVDNTKYMTPQATKQAIEKLSPVKNSLSEMDEDSTHRTVTDEEKNKWNKKFDLPVGKENQVLTKTIDGAEFKEISSSRSANFVIANYDSSENSKNGADYVIKESECTAEIINGFITKLPKYGGKIQLTEGNFNIKKNVTIELNKNNIVLEGYGQVTHIIDKQTKEQRSNKIIIISTGVENCQISNLKITHETSNSISNMGNKNLIKNINITNNGTNVPICVEEGAEENILKNCRVKGNSSYCFWTADSSKNVKLLNCTGDSGVGSFYIEGTNHQLLNCTGTGKSGCFIIKGTNHQLLNCTENSNRNGFAIEGTNHQLTNCIGTGGVNVFVIKGTNHQLTNCIGTGPINNGFYIEGTNHQLLNCTGTGDVSGFYIKGTKCIIVGNIAKQIKSSQAKDCIIANNITI